MKSNLSKRLQQIVEFLVYVEKFKLVERIPCLSDKTRRENDAEHSWHLALMIMALSKEIDVDFDLEKALKIALVHDLVEIETGDTWASTVEEKTVKQEREKRAADKIFSILPADLATEFYDLWLDYENAGSIESQIVKGFDKICYPLQYSISDKIVYPNPENDREKRRQYALPHTKFNETLTNLLDHFLDRIDENKKKD